MQTKAQKKRKLMTTKERRSTLFRYRIVITIPPWTVFVMAGAIGFALLRTPQLVTSIVSFCLTVAAVLCVWIARKQVRALRYDVHGALNDINSVSDDDEELTHKLEDYDPETFHLKKVNGKRSSRVSE